jgi:hypothetical protein
MKRTTFYGVFFGVAIMSLAFSSCARQPVTSWDSPRMLALKDEWNKLLKNPPPELPASKNDKLGEMEREILDKLSVEEMRHLATTCGTLPPHQRDPNAYEANVLQWMVVTFIKNGDRESLVTLLSTRFQEYVGPETYTSRYLLFCPQKALRDPILVLGEAYSRSKVPEARKEIAGVVRRGFDGFNISGKDDAEFVKNAMQWYEKNKTHLFPRRFGTASHPDKLFQDDREKDD